MPAFRMPALALLSTILLSLLSGCSDAPYAADQEPTRPSETMERTPIADATGTITAMGRSPPGALQVPVNCLGVYTDTEDFVQITGGSIELRWRPETPLVEVLGLRVRGDGEAATAGSSPLRLEWNAETGPKTAFFLVEVSSDDAILQSVEYVVHVDGYDAELETIETSCS